MLYTRVHVHGSGAKELNEQGGEGAQHYRTKQLRHNFAYAYATKVMAILPFLFACPLPLLLVVVVLVLGSTGVRKQVLQPSSPHHPPPPRSSGMRSSKSAVVTFKGLSTTSEFLGAVSEPAAWFGLAASVAGKSRIS